jgi:hypothetical protein
MKLCRMMFLLLTAAMRPVLERAQSLANSAGFSITVATTTPTKLELSYIRPTGDIKLRNYLFDAFGPYPFEVSGIAAGIHQEENAPPEWKQGAEGYSRRFASDFGTAAISTTTRYALAQLFREDTLYYRCECKGVFPRFGHAVISTFTGRHGDDGHRVFSLPALVAPYVGNMIAAYAWYPGRYNAMDGFRMGNCSLLQYAVENLALEFLYGGPHSMRSRMHLNNRHGALDSGSTP